MWRWVSQIHDDCERTVSQSRKCDGCDILPFIQAFVYLCLFHKIMWCSISWEIFVFSSIERSPRVRTIPHGFRVVINFLGGRSRGRNSFWTFTFFRPHVTHRIKLGGNIK